MQAFLLAALLAQAAMPPSQPARADAHVVVGWQNLHKPQDQEYFNNWLNAIFYGGAGAGWYWTDHLKTQIDVGAGTKGQQYRTRRFPFDNNFAYESSRLDVRQAAVTIGQQYQFFRNQWFHPHVGAGLELARETSTEIYQPVVFYGTNPPGPREILPARSEGPTHRFLARGVGEAGFKAYMTRRAFFTGDMRLMFRHGVDEVLFRTGFGVDF